MKKELPKVYANTIDKEIKNNAKVVYSRGEEVPIEVRETKADKLQKELEGSVQQKIKKIFNAQNYIYKADVVLTLKDKTVTKRIIGKNGNYLITYDNESIPIADILDITYK